MAALGTSIEVVHQSGPRRWGVRLAPDSIMLKIGPHEVLQIHSQEWERPFHLIINKNSVPPELRSRPELWFSEDREYYGNPGAGGYYSLILAQKPAICLLKVVKDVYQALLNAHTEVIARAAQKPMNPMTLRGHSPALVRFIAAMLGKS